MFTFTKQLKILQLVSILSELFGNLNMANFLKVIYYILMIRYLSCQGDNNDNQSREPVSMEKVHQLHKISWISPKQLDLGVADPAGVLNVKGDSPQFLYVARANYHDGVIPGQWNPVTESALIGNTKNKEIVVDIDRTKVLHMPKGSTSWVKMRKGQQFYNVVVGGMLPGSKVLLYICRAIRPGNNLVLGYRKQTGGNCTVSHGENN